MATPSFADASLAIGSKVGRYFDVVSMLPALFLTLWTAALLNSNAWRTAPDLKLLAIRMGNWSLTGIAWLLVATLLVALFLHPLQFAMTQLLEGYWGSSKLATRATQARIVHHRKQLRKFATRAEEFKEHWTGVVDDILSENFRAAGERGHAEERNNPAGWDEEQLENRRVKFLGGQQGDQHIGAAAVEQAAARSSDRYPAADRIMPTRLGNALRSVEDTAGKQYGLDAILTAPHLALVAAERHVKYLHDSRQQMDTSVRLCAVSLLATALSVACLLTDGLWLLVALGPYACAYIAYRASVSAASEYTTSVSTVIDLDRFALYESLRIDIPRDTNEERAVNQELMALLGGDKSANVRYTRPADPPRKRRPYLGTPK